MAQSPCVSGNFMPANFRVRGHFAMEYFTRSLLIVLSVVFSVTGDTVHLTVVTPTPYGAGSSQSSASISCFRSSPDADATLSFGRPFQIALRGSTVEISTTLPTGSSPSVNGQIVTQDLTTSNDATGLFYCEGSNRGLTTRVYSIIHSVNRRFEPVDGLVTKTVNIREDVTLSVIQAISGGSPLWRRTRNGTVNANLPNSNRASFTVPSTDAVDGDLYTVIGNTDTLADNHFSMIRLIVRGCVAGKWGPQCTGICDMCYNGGVCDDETGDCICPPGFSGPNCLTACGMHKFGWECEFQCGAGNVIQSCTGSQFGLPDPYGNSCISGYHGRDCDVACSAGSFGAGCTQTCHCQSGQCDAYTGECTGTPSGCEAGWDGTNCQIPDVCPVGYYGDNCLSKCHCLNDAACDKGTGYCSGSSGACAAGFQCVSILPVLSQPPSVSVASTSAIVSWQAWDSNVDAGDGPVIAYKVYYSLTSPISWTVANNVTVASPPQTWYSSTVQPLQPNTEYMFSMAVVREGPGGEGPRSPITTRTTLPESPPSETTTGPTTSESSIITTPESTKSNTDVIVLIVVVVIVVIIVGVAVYIYFPCHRKSTRQPAKTQSTGGQELTTYENQISPDNEYGVSDYERVGQDHPTSYEVVGVHLSSSTYEDVGLPSWAQGRKIPFKNVFIGEKILGKGNYGEVRDGAVMVGGEVSKAAIKTLMANSSENDRQNFMEEFRTLTKVGRHPNVVGILGACQHEDILYVALEFMPNGDLRTYLRNARSLGDDDQSTLSSEKLIQFALDVARGMQHVDAVGVIHRDLAARNILLDSQLVAKVSDFGLSRAEDIYVQMSRTRVPTRWLSLESLASKTYTSKSDVWSFGILLWEIATLGATPYEDIKSKDLLSRLQSGYRMPKPTNCDNEIHTLMLMCWQEDPDNRPHFKSLVTHLKIMADKQHEHTYMRLLPKADNYMYLMIRPELDDN
ncbi:angiopoietin-1 receptor-like [Patiria miniata]|uniref:receptor protein-tyrosine kinase n=1 Tax=Patiria miniata TaxID=46514 RepID=A0A914AS22_PATMI|nr:angiopoietin-1 receptor-like [Patiria miniata]